MRTFVTSLLLLGLAWAAPAQEKKPIPEPLPKPADEEEAVPRSATTPRPPIEIVMTPGEANGVPYKKGVSWANGGIIDVAQPNPTTIVVTMSGLSATNADLLCHSAAGYQFDLAQDFEVCFHSRRIRSAKLQMEGRVVGLLRTDHKYYTCCLCNISGTASTEPATAAISCGHEFILTLALPARATSCRQDLSVYNHEGPVCVPVIPGHYTLHQCWGFGTTHPPFFCRGASAEFSPQPQYCVEGGGTEGYWFSHFHPFNGTATKDFGFQVTIRVVPE
jgi:hypothetical protein